MNKKHLAFRVRTNWSKKLLKSQILFAQLSIPYLEKNIQLMEYTYEQKKVVKANFVLLN